MCTTKRPDYGQVEQVAGTRAMRFFWTQTGYDGTRMRRGAEACSDLTLHKEGWYGFRLRIPSVGYPHNKIAIIAQLFDLAGCKAGQNGTWAGTFRLQNDELWFDYRARCTTPVSVRLGTNLQRDTWIPLTIHFVASAAQAGKIEIWFNGAGQSTPTYRATGINFASWGTYTRDDQFADLPSNYLGLKFGMYNAYSGGYTPGETRTLYYDNINQLSGNPPNAFQLVNPN